MSFGLLAAVLAAGPAAAQSGSVRMCANQDESAATERIAACSDVLKSRRISGKPAGVAYALRGLAYLDRGDIPHAIADLDKAIELAPDFAPAYQNRGNAWYARGNFGRAIADYDAAIKLDGSNASAYANRGTVRRDVGYTEGAIEDYAKAISLEPRYARAYSGRGELYLQQANYSHAVTDFEQALRLAPNSTTYMLLGQAQTGAADYARALSAYAEAGRFDPQALAPINAQAGVYVRKGDFDKALALYDRALRIDPNAPATYRARAEAYNAKGDRKRALKEIDRVLKFTWTIDALKLRAQWRMDDGNLDGAVADIAHIDKLDPDGSASLALRGAVAARKKDYAAALTNLNRAIADNRNDAFALSERGRVHAAKGEDGAALSDLNQAIELGAGSAAYHQRGRLYKAKGDTARALADFDVAIRQDPANAASYFERAALRKAKGDSAGELSDLNDGLKRAPDNAPALYQRGLIKNAKNDVKGAIADFDAALKLDPKNADAIKSRALARASIKDKDVTQEIEDFSALIALEPKNAKNYYRRGLAHERNKDADKAKADFKTALAKDKSMKEARRALDRVTADSKHWPKKPVESAGPLREAAAPLPMPNPAAKPGVAAPPNTKAAAVEQQPKSASIPASTENGPPETAVSDRKNDVTAGAPKLSDAPLPPHRTARMAPETRTEPSQRSEHGEAGARAPHESRSVTRATNERHGNTRTTNERRSAQTQQTHKQRSQVRYYYYVNGRPVRFTDAFR